ncbi:MAG: UDP-N-acetylmuramate dehydrogenase [Slackia sp.]
MHVSIQGENERGRIDRADVREFAKTLAGIVGDKNVLLDEPMAKHTTFLIGGPADAYVIPQSVEEVAAVVRACRRSGVPYRIVGNGSDLLVADEGLRCVIVQTLDNLSSVHAEGNFVRAQAGATNEAVAHVAYKNGLAGFEFASGIPGTIGGAAIMNAGAYGGEFKDVAVELTCVTPEGDIVRVSREEADWSYRRSMMDKAGYVVVEALLRLEEDDSAAVKERMDDLQARREEKQPLEMPSAGRRSKP